MKIAWRILVLSLLLSAFVSADQSSSYGTTEGFYNWYIKAGDSYRNTFDQAKPYFTEDLYGLLSKGFKNGPKDGFWVDFDPFINAQMSATEIGVGKPYTAGDNLDMVPVSPFLRGMAPDKPTIKVYCVKQGDKWVIANLVYPGDAEMGVKPWNLKDHLKKGLGILSSGNDTGVVGEDPSTMLSGKEMLLGKWKHISSSPTIDGNRRPLGDINISWTFRADGTGEFYQKVSPSGDFAASRSLKTHEVDHLFRGKSITRYGRCRSANIKLSRPRHAHRRSQIGTLKERCRFAWSEIVNACHSRNITYKI